MSTLEAKLNRIIQDGKPKTVTHNKKSVYLSKPKLTHLQQKQREHEGGFLPLLTLLPLIFGGLAAAGGVATGVSSAVKTANEKATADAEFEELKRHNKALEEKVGSALFLNPYVEGRGIKDIIKDFAEKTNLKEEGKRLLKKTLKNLSSSIDVKELEGGALMLSPF